MMLARAARVARLYGKLQVLHLRAHLEYEADLRPTSGSASSASCSRTAAASSSSGSC